LAFAETNTRPTGRFCLKIMAKKPFNINGNFISQTGRPVYFAPHFGGVGWIFGVWRAGGHLLGLREVDREK